MSPNSEILTGLEFLFYGPVRVGVRVRIKVGGYISPYGPKSFSVSQ